MKNKIWISIVFLLFFIQKSQPQQYLGNHHIVHKYNKLRSKERFKWKKETKKTNTLYRNLEFDIMFDENCEYVLPDYWQYQQNYKQKVVTLCTSQNSDSKNSLRIGWCWDIKSSKIQLAFYAHINHIDSAYGGINGEVKGREHQLLNVNINTGQWVHVKMAIGKKGMFMSIDGKSIIVSRDIYSWSPDGEKTYVRAFSYFEFGKGNVNEGALHDMDFYIKNAYVDNPDFSWEKTICEYTAEDISFMNTNFAYTDQGPYQFFAGNSIYCSDKSNSPVETELPYEPAFTVIEPGIDVGFTAGNSIRLVKGFHAKAGSHFAARIQEVEEPVYPVVTNGPDVLAPTICYTVKNTDGFNFYLYADPEHQKWVTGGTGYVIGKNACFEIPGYNEIPNGKYYAVSVFDNACKLITEEDILFKKGKALLQGDIIAQNLAHKASVVQGNENGQIKTGAVDSMEKGLPPILSIYPNPNNGRFTIKTDFPLEKGNIAVFGVLGEKLRFETSECIKGIDINVQSNYKGVIFIKISASDNNYSSKLIIK